MIYDYTNTLPNTLFVFKYLNYTWLINCNHEWILFQNVCFQFPILHVLPITVAVVLNQPWTKNILRCTKIHGRNSSIFITKSSVQVVIIERFSDTLVHIHPSQILKTVLYNREGPLVLMLFNTNTSHCHCTSNQ